MIQGVTSRLSGFGMVWHYPLSTIIHKCRKAFIDSDTKGLHQNLDMYYMFSQFHL